jgi:hypothetical protein
MIRRLLLILLMAGISLAPLQPSFVVNAASAQANAAHADCDCPPEHQGCDRTTQKGCLQSSDCLLRCGISAPVFAPSFAGRILTPVLSAPWLEPTQGATPSSIAPPLRPPNPSILV